MGVSLALPLFKSRQNFTDRDQNSIEIVLPARRQGRAGSNSYQLHILPDGSSAAASDLNIGAVL